MKYYLDTNTCSYFMSQRYPQVTARLKSCEPKDLVIPSIVAAELAAGVENSASANKENNRIRLQALLSRFHIAPWDERAIWLFGKHKTRLWRAGTKIGELDLLIGCQALAADAVFVTNNVREFERIEGLQLENWV
jgi:tRNA(fMet)-specific endonuclease VapC